MPDPLSQVALVRRLKQQGTSAVSAINNQAGHAAIARQPEECGANPRPITGKRHHVQPGCCVDRELTWFRPMLLPRLDDAIGRVRVLFEPTGHCCAGSNIHKRQKTPLTLLRRGGPCLQARGERRLLVCYTACVLRHSVLRTERTVCTAPSQPNMPALWAEIVAHVKWLTDAPDGAHAAGVRLCRADVMRPHAAASSFQASCKPLA